MFGNPIIERGCLEKTYDGRMDVIGVKKETIDGETIVTPEALIYENQPCAVSHKQDAQTQQQEDNAQVQYTAKLFCAPELTIPAGCQITVTQYGQTRAFLYSGEAFFYPTHQELTVQAKAAA